MLPHIGQLPPVLATAGSEHRVVEIDKTLHHRGLDLKMQSFNESATTRALRCADIIAETIKQTILLTDVHLYPMHDRPLLSTLSLVCKAFNGPATKALWSRLDSFLPILNVLSAFDGKETVENPDPTYLLSEDIISESSHEYSRFCELGSFVRAVVPLPPGCVCEVDHVKPSVWFYLSQISGRESLFPHLQELHWFIEEPADTGLLLVASPSIQRLFVCYGGCGTTSREWSLSQSVLFRKTFNAVPRLTHLMIYDTSTGGALFSACLSNSNIDMLHNLRSLSLDEEEPVDLEVLRALSSLASLEELTIGINLIGDVDFTGFPAITKLDVTDASGSGSSSQVFNAFSSPHLRELSFCDRCNFANTDILFAISTTLTQRFLSMADLSLTFCCPFREGVSGAPLGAALTPLFPLPIAKFSLKIQATFVQLPPDSFFTALAQSWLHLRELSLVIPQHGSVTALSDVISTQTLVALARGCPHLHALRLPNMSFPQLGKSGGYPVLQHPLRSLALDSLVEVLPLGDERVPDDEKCAEFALVLDKLFPELDTRYAPSSGSSPPELWRRILSGVRLCQLGRSNRVM